MSANSYRLPTAALAGCTVDAVVAAAAVVAVRTAPAALARTCRRLSNDDVSLCVLVISSTDSSSEELANNEGVAMRR